MVLLVLLCIIASTAAIPLEYPNPPEALVLAIPEIELHTNLPNTETSGEHKVDNVISTAPIDESIDEEEEHIIILPALPNPPELPPVDASVLESLLKLENSEDFQDESDDIKPHYIEWKLPKIRFPGGYIINDIYGPRITLSA